MFSKFLEFSDQGANQARRGPAEGAEAQFGYWLDSPTFGNQAA